MKSITLTEVPEDLHAVLEGEAEANFRSLPQEILARLQRSLEQEGAMHARRDQRWVDEALASGPESPLTQEEMDKVRNRVLGRE